MSQPPSFSKQTPQPGNVMPLRIADHARAIRHVFVRDLMLHADIGVYAHEKGREQPLRFNVDLTVSEAAHSDELANVVCYEQVANQIKDLVNSGRVNLVETLAEQIASACLEDQRVLAVRVRVEKLAAIPEAAAVGVEIERSRLA
ncbi:dihydroneopterin aldolase [Tepidicaulis sp. LMO-SS28]|uniref:dihydroneopterin aldolase n=1 Tax=Tepidicaulis sp. LMO-SS28 TaxID=3447455 RepID=UPI003EE350B9